MSDAVVSQAGAIRRYVKSQNPGLRSKGISQSAKKVTGAGSRKTRNGSFAKTAKQTRGRGTITPAALKRLTKRGK